MANPQRGARLGPRRLRAGALSHNQTYFRELQ